ncbi:MAG: isoleucine--tRNA ligase [Alphaproteobacteria bacterium]|uniref:Isoleucine--tRNA ligase n=1 Tax=Candidatus Nitrobium versatile TaxID=2884831 RepID=A0A953JA49_9BACT|nr:isoleucine--tRNA ligase [Candidatus Nitrobium versatile]
MDYKDTLNLPQTDFPMKANLNQREPEMLSYWEGRGIYRKLQEKNRGDRKYILHDGPPYANGNIHIGHALNKILKDIIVKHRSMQGYYSPYVPGWDCHGLPIELQVDKNLGDKKEQVDILKKRQLCREYAGTFVEIQREEFKRLGVFGDWDDPYLTLSFGYEASIVREFFRFVKNGMVYKGKKPVHWCPSCVTALAEAEVEYAEKESPSIFVRFRVLDEDLARSLPELAGKPAYIVIWTTTPWTLPANLALAVNPELIYAAVEEEGEIHIVAEDNLGTLKEKGVVRGEVVLKTSGERLEGMRARHPFLDRESKVILGDFVSVGEGSGIVHIAPGHGEDDYNAGLKYGLDIYAPVDDRGRFTKAVPPFEGQFVFKANEGIIETLREKQALLGVEKIRHSYPHCWRCKKPVIFRATAQWFISMEKGDLRKKSLEEIGKVRWVPSWGRDRIFGMVSNRPDWCVSRQRAWGVPITLITCDDCGEFVNDPALFDRITGLVEEHGADVWFTRGIEEFLGRGYACTRCGGSSFRKETDILDVWFDSGVSHAAVLERDERLSWPADMYLEGSDQHRGWFQSSLLASVGTRGKAPYRTVLTHGFTVDGQGKKMSKSLGNVIAPQEIIKANGAEIIRLWVSAEDYRDDIRLSKEIINRLTEAYRKIRNTGRFLLGTLSDFDGSDYSGHLLEIDRWALSRLQGLIRKVSAAYENFDFHEVFHSLYNFCIVDMSSFYLDILKDRLYTFRKESPERRAAQWVMCRILVDMTRLMAPILSFTAEEIWSYLSPRQKPSGEGAESVFLSGFPAADEGFLDEELEKRWEGLIRIRDEANKALEIKRKEKFIGNALEAQLVLYAPEKTLTLLKNYRDFLPALFIVSGVELHPDGEKTSDAYESPEIKDLSIRVDRASGQKCERCWNWSITVGKSPEHPGVCERCMKALS